MMDLSIYGLSKRMDYVYVSLAYRSGSRRFRSVVIKICLIVVQKSIILASMLASNGRLRFEKRNGKGKRLVKSGWLRGGLLSHERNEKLVTTAPLLHGLPWAVPSEKLSFSIIS